MKTPKKPWMNPAEALQILSQLPSDQPIVRQKKTKLPAPTTYEQDTDLLVQDILVAGSLRELLRQARAENDSSLRHVAQKAGMAHTQLLSIENSNGKVELATLARIAEAMQYELRIAFVPKEPQKRLLETRL
jgi:DNA-binding phage protein